jgi:hypothetical protein
MLARAETCADPLVTDEELEAGAVRGQGCLRELLDCPANRGVEKYPRLATLPVSHRYHTNRDARSSAFAQPASAFIGTILPSTVACEALGSSALTTLLKSSIGASRCRSLAVNQLANARQCPLDLRRFLLEVA